MVQRRPVGGARLQQRVFGTKVAARGDPGRVRHAKELYDSGRADVRVRIYQLQAHVLGGFGVRPSQLRREASVRRVLAPCLLFWVTVLRVVKSVLTL